MTCLRVGDAIICGDFGNTVPQRRYGRCPHCKTTRRIIVEHGSPWYPPGIYCCACGLAWSVDEMRRRKPTRAQSQKVPALKGRWLAARRTVTWDDDGYPVPYALGVAS